MLTERRLVHSRMYTTTTHFTAIILSLLLTATSAAPLTGTPSSLDLWNTTTSSNSLNTSTILRHPDGLGNNTCQLSPTPEFWNSIPIDVPNTDPVMTLLFFAFGPSIPRNEFQFANLEAVDSVAASIRRGNGPKPILGGFWKFRIFFEEVASVEYAIVDHSQLGEEKAITYIDLLNVIRGIGYFSLDNARYGDVTFDVSIAGRDSVGAGHVERILTNDPAGGSGCESNNSSEAVAVT